MLANFKIRKFNPEVDREPYYKDYQIEVPDRSTVLEAIIALKEEQDGTLAYRCACRSAICGSCAMRINRCSKLACETRASAEIDHYGGILLEPLQRMTVIKDLVVDMDPFWRALETVHPWLMPDAKVPEPDKERLVYPEQMGDIMRESLCILCGACYSDCNVIEQELEFIGPAALARGHRFVADPRDAATEERLRNLSQQHGLWECCRCFECSEVCPKDVDPRESIRQIGHAAYENGIRADWGVKHAQAFLDSVRASGRLNEATLPLKTQGLGVLGLTPMAIRMVLKGKMPLPIQRPVPHVEEIRRIFELTEKK